MKAEIPLGALMIVLLLSTTLYIWTKDVVSFEYTMKDVSMLGQMILSVSKVDLIEANQYNLPWSGKTWLITLVVNPQEAESILAKIGYLEDTVPKEEIASNNLQAKYDLKIRITPVVQECIYGPDFSTYRRLVPVRVYTKQWDLGSGLLCPHANDWKDVYAEQYKKELLGMGYDDVAYDCIYYCSGVPKHAWLVCDFIAEKAGDNIGEAKLTLKSLYVKDRISVTAGYKTATGEATDKIDISSSNPTALLMYGTQVVGKVDLVGYLKASTFCPEGSNYFVFNNGQGWKIVPENDYIRLINLIQPLERGNLQLSECEYINSYDDFYRCAQAYKRYADTVNSLLDSINNRPPTISGKPASRPSASEYSASYFFAIKPDDPVVYSMYRMYLKADWVGILVSAAKPEITSVSPTSITLTGPESKTVSVTVRNVGDEGGVIVKVICSNDFLVDGKSSTSKADTIPAGGSRTFYFNVSYGGSGRTSASSTCTVEAVSSANPTIKDTATFTVVFKPIGVYPPNTTVCITSTSYAKTDQNGNIIPGTEKKCPEGSYCVQTEAGARCEKEEITPPTQPQKEQSKSPISLLIAAAIGIAIIIAFIIALIV